MIIIIQWHHNYAMWGQVQPPTMLAHQKDENGFNKPNNSQ